MTWAAHLSDDHGPMQSIRKYCSQGSCPLHAHDPLRVGKSGVTRTDAMSGGSMETPSGEASACYDATMDGKHDNAELLGHRPHAT